MKTIQPNRAADPDGSSDAEPADVAVTPQRGAARSTEFGHLAPLFDELARSDTSESHRQHLREQLVCGYLSVAEHIARRFAQRGMPLEDLRQVARLGLVNAVDRFDPERGKDFLSFAVPTITGEVRRHFRDHGWVVRVPRRLQELRGSINQAVGKLSQATGRAPTARELAEHLGTTVDEVQEAFHLGTAYSPSSLEHLARTDEEEESTTSIAHLVGANDERFGTVDDQSELARGLARLPERERTIVGMRFLENMTQTQIAERMRISQMHVSRLLSRSLTTLRAELSVDAPAPTE